MVTPRDLALARTAKKHGANYALRIIMQARKSGIPISLAFALIEQESNFKNVFGHDPSIFSGAGNVTKKKYQEYKRLRDAQRPRRMQGVGPAQLTWWEFQDRADARGGAWIPKHNISLAFDDLAAQIKAHGLHDGIKAYNGRGPDAERYANQVLAGQKKWHDWLA